MLTVQGNSASCYILRTVAMNQVEQLFEAQAAFRDFIRRRVPSADIADDLLQQSLLKAVEQAHTVRKSESIVPWFYRLLRHAIIDYYRAHAADERKRDAILKELAASDADQVPPVDHMPPEVCSCLNRLLPALRPAYADILQRVDLGGESIQSVAQELKTTPNNLTVRLHRARQALRTSLEEACGVCTKHGCLDCTCA